MTNEEFFEWLDTCPSHKFEVINSVWNSEGESVRVMVKPKGDDND